MLRVKLVILSTILAAPIAAQTALGQTAAPPCEIVSVKKVAISEDSPHGIAVISKPADAFLQSVYDDKDGYLSEIDGEPVKAIFCTRSDIIPTLRDFPVLATGLPFSISQDLTSSDSPVLTLFYKDGTFQYHYAGLGLTDEEQLGLDDVMEIFNLQPHDLDEG